MSQGKSKLKLVESKVYDISKITKSGQLVLPLSMAKLENSQSPEEIYKVLSRLANEKLKEFGTDVYLFYTNGLYQNSNEVSLSLRTKSSHRVANHSQSLKNMILKRQDFSPKAFHFISWDYLILNSNVFSDLYVMLVKEYESKGALFKAINYDIQCMNREINKANVSFIIEELALNHILRNKLVDLPTSLSENSSAWRLIAYSGSPLYSDVVLVQEEILPMNRKDDFKNRYSHHFYDWGNREFLDYRKINSIADNLTYLDAPSMFTEQVREDSVILKV